MAKWQAFKFEPILDCSQSPIFPRDFRDSYAYRTPAILLCNGESNLGTVSNLREVGGGGKGVSQDTLIERGRRSVKISLDTLPRLRPPLQTKVAGVRLKHTRLENPTEK